MKKRLSIILLLFTIFLSSITYVDEVWGDNNAGSDYKDGTQAAVASCNSGIYCFSGAVGFRITLVNTKTGERCKYDPKTNTVCGESGNETISSDYWFSLDDLAFTESETVNYVGNPPRMCYSYTTKKTKFEFLNDKEKNPNSLKNLISYSCTAEGEKSFTELGFPAIDSGSYLSAWDSYDNKIEPSRVPKNMGLVKDYLLCTLGGKTEDGKPIKCTNVNGKKIKKDYTIINNIFRALTNDSNVDVSKIEGLDKVNIQFDQLLQIGNYSLYSGDSGTKKRIHTAFVTKGTVAEASYLYMEYGKNDMNIKHFGCVTEDQTGFKNANTKQSCGSSMVGGGYFTGYYGDTTYVDAKKTISIPEKDSPVRDLESDTYKQSRYNLELGNFFVYAVPLNSFLKWDTSNIYRFWIDPTIGEGNCNDNARKILTSSGINGFNKTGKSVNSINYDDLEKKLKQDKKIFEVCYKNNSNKTLTLSDDCYQLSEEYLKNVGVAPSTPGVDLCKPSNCSSTVEQINNNFRVKKGAVDVNGYEEIINYLYKELFTTDGGLNSIIWKDFYDEPASCDRIIPPCAPTSDPSVAKCTSGTGEKEIIFKDSNDTVNCIQQGIAYNNLFNASDGVPSVIESSKDKYYSSKGFGDVYCTEEVKFIIPNGGQTAVAGTVFKWGINIDKSDNVFGTMKVTRTCYLSDKFRDGTTKTFDSYWVWDDDGEKEIDPTISIKYKQAKNHDLDVFDVNTSLGIRLREYDSYTNPDGLGDKNRIIYKKDGTLDTTEIKNIYPDIIVDKITDKKYIHDTVAGEKDNDPRTITCKTNDDGENTCANIQYITTTATYDIFYKDDLKWFSDKSLNGELITIGAEGLQPSYTFAGYGLPTSFPNPHNEICSQWNDTTLPDDFNKANGELNLYVYNVGTGGHFNDLIGSKDLFEDDDDANNNEINYYCDYKIKNKLFDNEYALKEEYMCDPNRTPKGIDVVFRTIDLISNKDELNKAFPGRSGSGREMGANWYKFSDESIADLLGDNVYNQEPMYEITLDSPTIQKIREWNRAARSKDIDPYTDMEESKASDASDDSYGFTGYEYYTITKNFDGEDHEYSFVASKFLEALDANFEHFNTDCIISVGNTFTRRENCNQSWWKEGLDKHTISMELRTPIGG